MRAIDADALQLAIVEEGQANKRKKYIIGDIWELTGAEIREVINSQPTIQPEIIRCKDCKHYGRVDKRRFYRGYDCLDGRIASIVPDKDFCSRAERREVTE